MRKLNMLNKICNAIQKYAKLAYYAKTTPKYNLRVTENPKPKLWYQIWCNMHVGLWVCSGDRNKINKVIKKNKQDSYLQVHMLIQQFFKSSSYAIKELWITKLITNQRSNGNVLLLI